MTILFILDILSEIIYLVFQLGVFCRRYIVPAGVYLYVGIERYIIPALSIPQNYMMVRRMRLVGIE